MKKNILIAAALVSAAILSASCQDGIEPVGRKQDNSVFTATIDQGMTRTNLEKTGNNYKVEWESGDKITVNGAKYTAVPTQQDATKATFTADASEAEGTTFYAFYPETIQTGNSAVGSLPASSDYVAYSVGNLPMYATGTSKALTFYNICGVIKVSVPSNIMVSSIVVSSDLAMNGAFTIENNAVKMSKTSNLTDADKQVTLNCGANGIEGTDFYIPVPPADYTAKNLTITVNPVSGDPMVKATNQSNTITVAASTIYPIEFTSTKTEYFGIKCVYKYSETGEVKITLYKDKDECAPNVSLKYSTDCFVWHNFDGRVTLKEVGDKVFFKGNNKTFNAWNENNQQIVGNQFLIEGGKVELLGNIMTLLDGDNPSVTLSDADQKYAFSGLFDSQGEMIVEASRLKLPATTLSEGCYKRMFTYNHITSCPSLPATNLANSCYDFMFAQCEKIKKGPELPAKCLKPYCYSEMFYQCDSLIYAPDLPADELAVGCYSNMFHLCTNLIEAPQSLPATALKPYCYTHMFRCCENLINAPSLPATVLL